MVFQLNICKLVKQCSGLSTNVYFFHFYVCLLCCHHVCVSLVLHTPVNLFCIIFLKQDLPMAPEFFCLVRCKSPSKIHKAVCCDICNKWVHIACNIMNKYNYQKLQKFKASWYCKSYIKKFSEVTDNTYKKFFELISPNLKNYFSDDETQVLEEFSKSI